MMESERRQVLEMLAAGKISVNEAAEILNLLGQASAKVPVSAAATDQVDTTPIADAATLKDVGFDSPPTDWQHTNATVKYDDLRKPRWLRIRVRDLGSGRNKVNISLPLGLVSLALRVAGRFGGDLNGAVKVNDIEMGQMMVEALREGNRGMLVDVEDAEEGEHVQIFLD